MSHVSFIKITLPNHGMFNNSFRYHCPCWHQLFIELAGSSLAVSILWYRLAPTGIGVDLSGRQLDLFTLRSLPCFICKFSSPRKRVNFIEIFRVLGKSNTYPFLFICHSCSLYFSVSSLFLAHTCQKAADFINFVWILFIYF